MLLTALTACDKGGGGGDDGGGASPGSGADGAGAAGGGSTGEGASGGTAAASTGGAAGSSSSGGLPDNCGSFTTCETCGDVSGCGWCGARGTCLPGTAEGPGTGTCGDGWLTEGDLFSCGGASCAAHTDCESCAAQLGCGFCASSGKCIAGSTEGPAPQWGSCDIDSYHYSACPSDCAGELTCISCVKMDINGPSDNGCGWCGAINSCVPGTVNGPTDAAACGGGWNWDVQACL
ncbi:MAG: hypothetical protein WKG00_35180 [Polyangiaceae bacterium]